MIFLFVLLLLGVPYILGTAFTVILGERTLRGPVRWVVGVLSVFVCFFASLLIELKLHGSLNDLTKLFGIILTAFTAGSVPVVLYGFAKKDIRLQNFDKKILIWVIPAIVLGAFSVFVLAPSYVNDVTVETVRTTLYTGRIYEYSSLLGTKMEAGLPIFVKIEIAPMLYACICNAFHIDILVLTGTIVPIMTYTAHLFVMNEISAYAVKEKHRSLFMIFHLLMLLAGTYLPDNAIPVTMGRPLLMQGYSGFAWGFGVLMPMIILVCLQKRFCLAAFLVISFTGLIKSDRFFFAAVEGLKSYLTMNLAGKLFALYVFSVIFQLIRKKSDKTPLPLYFLGTTLISKSLVDAYEYIGEKKTFAISAGLLIMACCSFMPFKGATFSFEKEEINVSEIKGDKSEVTVWAPKNIMENVRLYDASVCPVYGRDLFNPAMLAGINFEPYSEDSEDLLKMMTTMEVYTDDYVDSIYCPALKVNKELDKVDVIMLPGDTLSDKIEETLVSRGFTKLDKTEEYLIMRKD